jgi:hypothetical protein
MKKITEIKAFMAEACLLTPCQMLKVKGGLDSTTTTSATEDDKRRARPGGGATTQ